MGKILRLKIVGALMLITSIAWAQTRTVSGKATSEEDGSALPGVNVLVKGTTNGTSTDANGAYSIVVSSSDDVLIFSFIGLATKEITVGGQSVIDIQLKAD